MVIVVKKKEKVDIRSFKYRLGQNIARIRLENGLTHKDMEEYGITRGYYGKIELGLYSVSVDKLELIARAFGVNISDLFKDENGKEIL